MRLQQVGWMSFVGGMTLLLTRPFHDPVRDAAFGPICTSHAAIGFDLCGACCMTGIGLAMGGALLVISATARPAPALPAPARAARG